MGPSWGTGDVGEEGATDNGAAVADGGGLD